MAKTDYVANGRLILNRPDAQTYRDIWDGTSHTILLGEKAFDPWSTFRQPGTGTDPSTLVDLRARLAQDCSSFQMLLG